jgi:hypothetical protein
MLGLLSIHESYSFHCSDSYTRVTNKTINFFIHQILGVCRNFTEILFSFSSLVIQKKKQLFKYRILTDGF